MIKVNYTPVTDIEEFLNDDFNIEIFNELNEDEDWKGLFDSVEFLNLLYEQNSIVLANNNKPLTVKKHLLELSLNKNQLYYFLHYLLKLLMINHHPDYDQYAEPQLIICHDFIKKEYKKLEKELYPKEEVLLKQSERKFDFEKVKDYLKTIADNKEKIVYLIEISTEFKQNKTSFDMMEWGTPFDQQCDLEIKKLEKLLKLEPIPQIVKSEFKLSRKNGARTDLIRVLNALYEMRFIDDESGQTPTKEEFMKRTGQFFGVDLSKYDVDLSQAFKNTSLETNIKIFEDMKTITQKVILEKLEK